MLEGKPRTHQSHHDSASGEYECMYKSSCPSVLKDSCVVEPPQLPTCHLLTDLDVRTQQCGLLLDSILASVQRPESKALVFEDHFTRASARHAACLWCVMQCACSEIVSALSLISHRDAVPDINPSSLLQTAQASHHESH